VLGNLAKLTYQIKDIQDFLGPLTLLRLITQKIKLDDMGDEMKCDVIISFRRLIKISDSQLVDEMFTS
jgi:hypothetical protein